MITTARHLELLRRVCVKYISTMDNMDLCDLVQEAWLKTRTLTVESHIIVKARSVCHDVWRFQNRQKRKGDAPLPADTTTDPDIKTYVNELIAMANLTPVERDIIFRLYYQGQTYRDIRADTGLCLATIKERKDNAFRKLKLISEEIERN